jgi:hypothetical protein
MNVEELESHNWIRIKRNLAYNVTERHERLVTGMMKASTISGSSGC